MSPHAPSTATAGQHLSHARAIMHPRTPSACRPPHGMYLSPNVLPTHTDAPPTPSAHPLHATAATLSMPLPLPSLCHCRRPLHATTATLSVPPPSPSPYHPCRPLRNTPVALSLPPLPPSHVSMPPGDARLAAPDMRRPTCTTPPRRCPTHCCTVPPAPCRIHRPQMPPYSPPFGALRPTLLPLACPHALRASPTHTHVPPGSDRPHGPPMPPPSRPGGSHAPPTCHCPHQCVMPLRALTDTPQAPPGVRHHIYVSHGVVPIPEWLRCLQLRVRCWKIDTAVYPW